MMALPQWEKWNAVESTHLSVLLTAASCQPKPVQISDDVEADNSSVTSNDASPVDGPSDNAERQ